jgi:hypothetical protein
MRSCCHAQPGSALADAGRDGTGILARQQRRPLRFPLPRWHWIANRSTRSAMSNWTGGAAGPALIYGSSSHSRASPSRSVALGASSGLGRSSCLRLVIPPASHAPVTKAERRPPRSLPPSPRRLAAIPRQTRRRRPRAQLPTLRRLLPDSGQRCAIGSLVADHWSARRNEMDLRLRLAAGMPLVAEGMRITEADRDRMLSELPSTGITALITNPAKRYGLESADLAWRETPEPEGFNNNRFGSRAPPCPRAAARTWMLTDDVFQRSPSSSCASCVARSASPFRTSSRRS